MGFLKSYLLLFILFIPGALAAQNIAFTRTVGFALHPGFVFAHTEDAQNMQAHTMGFELQLGKTAISNRKWTDGYRNPKTGINFLYMNLGQPELTGNVFAIIPNFETTLSKSPKHEISMRIGTGLGYLTRRFDPFTNRRNLSIGSHMNGAMQIFFLYNWQLEKMRLNAGLGLTHFSNASVNVPNLGVNMPSIYLGAHYFLNDRNKKPLFKDTTRVMPYEFYAAIARNERSIANPTKFVVGHFAALKLKRISKTRFWHFGVDVFLDKTHVFMEDPEKSRKGLMPWEMTEIGARVGYIWRMSCIDFSTDVGLYAWRPSKNKAFTYQMLGLKYNLNDSWFLQGNLKIHYGTADFFDIGMGYKLKSLK